MLTKIENLFPSKTLKDIHQLLSEAPFINGKLSTGMAAKEVKNNLEMDNNSEHYNHLNELIMGRLVRHPLYRASCWPKQISAPFYARYEPGMGYGEHVDDPVMGQVGDYYRSDISLTIFLSNKNDYDGGELVILDSFGEQRIKLDAGSVVFYPSSSRHYVTPVTRGIRLVAVTWVQSTIRDPQKREILFELNEARELLLQQPESDASKKVSAVFNNLVRAWIDV